MELLLSVLPIASVLVCLLVLNTSGTKSALIGCVLAVLIYAIYYQSGVFGILVSVGKGLSLSLYVLLIIWSAIYMYNLVNTTGALNVINKNIQILIKDRFLQFILLSWIFSAFLQGIAGFGVPVAVVTPILIAMGFDPIISVASVLIGHSWAISFGSMGSSISAIDLVTNADIGDITHNMAIFGTVAAFMTGLMVCYLFAGIKGIKKGLPFIMIITVFMGGMLFITTSLGMLSLVGLSAGLTGIIVIIVINKIKNKNAVKENLYKDKLNFLESLMPYILVVIFSLMFYLMKPDLVLAIDFPEYVTNLGRIVEADDNYVKFNILKFPFTIILLSSLVSIFVYKRRGVFTADTAKSIVKATVAKCTSTTKTICLLLIMAVILMDSGMIECIAGGLVSITGKYYPIMAPSIGALGAFVTGSNTNSNIIFGSLQELSANELGLSAAVICAAQSIGASVGCAIGPTTTSLGAAAAQLENSESKIYKKTLVPVLIIIIVLGITNFLII